MANPYAGVNTYHATTILPSDGDPAVAESVNSALRDLTDDAVYLNTQLGHQAFDDRGKTSTVTGNVVLNDGGGSVTLNLPFTNNGETDLDVTRFHGDVVVLTGSAFQVNDDATFGNTGTDQFSVNAHADFYAETVFHNDVVITTGDNLTAKGPVLFEGETTTIQSPLNQIGLDEDSATSVFGSLTINAGGLTIGRDLLVARNATIGNGSTDVHTVNGDITANNDVNVAEDLTVDGATELNNGVEVHGTAQLFSHLTVAGNTTIGNSSSDTLTVNAQLVTPLGFTSAGRVPQRPTQGPDANTSISVTSTNLVTVPFGGLTATRTYTLEDGTVDGDEMLISTLHTTHLLVVDAGASAASIQAGGPLVPDWLRYVWLSGSWRLIERG